MAGSVRVLRMIECGGAAENTSRDEFLVFSQRQGMRTHTFEWTIGTLLRRYASEELRSRRGARRGRQLRYSSLPAWAEQNA